MATKTARIARISPADMIRDDLASSTLYHLWIDQVMDSHGSDGWWDAVLASASILDADVALIDRAMDAGSEDGDDMPTPEEAGCDYVYCQSIDDMRRCVLSAVLHRAAERVRPIAAYLAGIGE